MNTLISQHNAFVDLAQTYMNCISEESSHDQTLVNQSIAMSAQKDIADVQDDISKDSVAIRNRKQ